MKSLKQSFLAFKKRFKAAWDVLMTGKLPSHWCGEIEILPGGKIVLEKANIKGCVIIVSKDAEGVIKHSIMNSMPRRLCANAEAHRIYHAIGSECPCQKGMEI